MSTKDKTTPPDQEPAVGGLGLSEGVGLGPERATVSLTLADLQMLAVTASRNDTHHAFQAVALEWCGKAQAEIERLNAQRRELQAERERLLDSLARAGLEASRMVRQERHEIAQWLEGQGQPGYAHEVRFRA